MRRRMVMDLRTRSLCFYFAIRTCSAGLVMEYIPAQSQSVVQEVSYQRKIANNTSQINTSTPILNKNVRIFSKFMAIL